MHSLRNRNRLLCAVLVFAATLWGLVACQSKSSGTFPPVEYSKQSAPPPAKTSWLRFETRPTGLAMISIVPVFAQIAPAQPDLTIAPAVANPLPPELDTFVTEFIVRVARKYPLAAQVLGWLVAFVGFMRLWAKPLFSGLHALVDMTPSKFDDGLFARFRTFLLSPGGAWLHFLLDYLCSIKIVPPNAKPNAVAAAIEKKDGD